MTRLQNLADVDNVNGPIVMELLKARIPDVLGGGPHGESRADYVGRLEGWTLKRNLVYWCAHATTGQGLPLDAAVELNNRLGSEVRVAGYDGGADPIKHATPIDDDGFILVEDPTGDRQKEMAEIDRLTPNVVYMGMRCVESLANTPHQLVINSYNIDTLEGLQAFADAVRAN